MRKNMDHFSINQIQGHAQGNICSTKCSPRAALVSSLGDWRRAQQFTHFLSFKIAQIRNIPYVKWAYKTTNVSHLISEVRKVMRPYFTQCSVGYPCWPLQPLVAPDKIEKKFRRLRLLLYLYLCSFLYWEGDKGPGPGQGVKSVFGKIIL